MASQGPTLVASASDLGDNGNPWSSPTNITLDNGSAASASTPLGPTNTLRGTMGANAFTTTSAVTGVQVDVKCSQPSGGAMTFSLLRLTEGGASLGTDQSASTAVPTTISTVSFGGSTSTMGAGASIAQATANSSTFGVDMQFSGSAADSVNAYAARLTVTFAGGATESSELIISRMCICG